MAQDLLVALVRPGKPGQTVPHFGNHEKVHGRLRVNVPEGEALVVLVDHVGGNLLADDLRARIPETDGKV